MKRLHLRFYQNGFHSVINEREEAFFSLLVSIFTVLCEEEKHDQRFPFFLLILKYICSSLNDTKMINPAKKKIHTSD